MSDNPYKGLEPHEICCLIKQASEGMNFWLEYGSVPTDFDGLDRSLEKLRLMIAALKAKAP